MNFNSTDNYNAELVLPYHVVETIAQFNLEPESIRTFSNGWELKHVSVRTRQRPNAWTESTKFWNPCSGRKRSWSSPLMAKIAETVSKLLNILRKICLEPTIIFNINHIKTSLPGFDIFS